MVVVYRHVGRDVRVAGGVSIDTAQPVGGVTLRLQAHWLLSSADQQPLSAGWAGRLQPRPGRRGDT